MFAWLEEFRHSPKSDKKSNLLPVTNLTFSEALDLLKDGHSLRRTGWGDRNAFIFLTYTSEPDKNRHPLPGGFNSNDLIDYRDYVAVYISQTASVVPWVPQQYDLLGSDWKIHKMANKVVNDDG